MSRSFLRTHSVLLFLLGAMVLSTSSCGGAGTATPYLPTTVAQAPTAASPTVAPPTTVPTTTSIPLMTSTSTRVPTDTPIPPTATIPPAPAVPYDEAADARKDIAEAQAQAKIDKKHVLLVFGANWCPDCVALSKIFHDPSVWPFLDANYHVVKVDIGNWKKNMDVNKDFGSPVNGYVPAAAILDWNGQIVTTAKDKRIADARSSTKQEILEYLIKWAPKKP
jgi:thioredoxin 1